MRRGSSVGVILLLVLGFFAIPTLVHAQGAGPPDARERGPRLEQNYPNPFNPETRIPFVLDDGMFDDGRPVLVTIRVFNVLYQLVAVPTALNHPERPGAAVQALLYSAPGRYEAHWDGRWQNTGQEVASGPYFVEFTVHGYPSQVKRITVAK